MCAVDAQRTDRHTPSFRATNESSIRTTRSMRSSSGPPQPRQLPFGPLMSMRLTTAHYARGIRQFIQRLTGVALNLLSRHDGWTLYFPAPGHCLGSCRPTFQVRQETRSLSLAPEPHSSYSVPHTFASREPFAFNTV